MLAKIVGEMADELLASVVRAWDTTRLISAVDVNAGMGAAGGVPARKRIVMTMLMQPVTAGQVRVLEEWGWRW